MTPSRSLIARLSRLRRTNRDWIFDYGLWKLHRLEDRFPRRTDRRLRPLSRDLLEALVRTTGADREHVEQAREEFHSFSLKIEPFVGLYAVSDAHLTELQYVITRLLQPRVAVETGVWRGCPAGRYWRRWSVTGSGRS